MKKLHIKKGDMVIVNSGEDKGKTGKVLKVIVETSQLSEGEKIRICKIVSDAKPDFIKTSTGFDTHGATIEDVRLMKANVSSDVRIKAAGGIRSIEDARQMIEAGAIRIGASNLS